MNEARSPRGPEITELAQLPATALLSLTYLYSSFRVGLSGPNASIIIALRLHWYPLSTVPEGLPLGDSGSRDGAEKNMKLGLPRFT